MKKGNKHIVLDNDKYSPTKGMKPDNKATIKDMENDF